MAEQITVDEVVAPMAEEKSLRERLANVGKVIAVGVTGLAIAASSIDPNGTPQDSYPIVLKTELIGSPALTSNDAFLNQVGNSLLAMGESSRGGLRFRSAIQAPNYHTDPDVGAAGVINGFLSIAERRPNDKRYQNAADKTAKWLVSVSKTDGHGGRYWPDYVNDGKTSSNTYTSYDDGTIGVGDALWRAGYKNAARQSVDWTLSQAENIAKDGDPEIFRWKWDAADKYSSYQLGMGEGSVGIIHTLTTYYQRFKSTDPAEAAKIKRYIDGGLRYIERAKTNLEANGGDGRAMPETGEIGQDGDTIMNSGYLSGTAGEAFMYLKLHQVFGGQKYLAKANEALSWLADTKDGPMVRPGNNMVAWNIALDPQDSDNKKRATGFEEGAAGIGWVYLQAYKLTGNNYYLSIAKQAGNWLNNVAAKPASNQMAWHEHENPASKLVHANLNNGAAGIGFFLKDLGLVTHETQYNNAAQKSLNWIKATAIHKGNYIYWHDNGGVDPDTGKSSPYQDDPSDHWGKGGIGKFSSRMSGGKIDDPGMHKGL